MVYGRANPGTIIFEDVLASRPAAGVVGRFFYATDTSQMFFDNGVSWDSVGDSAGDQAAKSANEHTGFILEDGVAVDNGGNALALSYVNGTRTLTVTPTSADFTFYSANDPFTITGADSIVWTDTEGLHYFYYDTDGVLKTTTTFDESFILGPKAFVSYVYWNADDSEVIFDAFIEIHGHQMDGATHFKLHEDFGASWRSGLTLSDIDADASGNNDTSAQFGVTSGGIADEDLQFTISALATTTPIPILYLDGASANLREIEEIGGVSGESYPVLTDNTAGVDTTGRLVWNEFTGGAWQLTTVGSNDYVLCHVFAIGGTTKRLYAMVGQDEYGNAGQARAGANVEIANILQQLPVKEILPIATVIFQTVNSYNNEVKARIRTTDEGDDYIDWRTTGLSNGSGATPSDHASLTNRDAPNAHPGTAVSLDVTNFDNNLSSADDTVQKAMETIDEMAGGSGDIVSELVNTPVTVNGVVTLSSTAFGKIHEVEDDGTPADYTITLPTAAGNAKSIIAFRVDSAATKKFTVDGSGSETIDGSDSIPLGKNDFLMIYSDGTNWLSLFKRLNVWVLRTANAGQEVTADTEPIDWEDIVEESVHVSYSSGTWTVAEGAGGLYKFLTNLELNGSGSVRFKLYVNGSHVLSGPFAETSNVMPFYTSGYRLADGDTFSFRLSATRTTNTVSERNHVTVCRVGD